MYRKSLIVFRPDEPAGGDPDPTAAPAGEPAPQDPPTVPVGELTRERRARQEAERELRKLQEAEAERERAQLGDVERLTADVASLTAERDRLTGEVAQRDKADLIRGAAKDFHSPDDAVALLGGAEGIEDAATAAEAVKALARERPHLVKVPGAPSGAGSVEQVTAAGLGSATQQTASTDAHRTLSRDEYHALGSKGRQELMRTEPAVYSRTVAALTK